MFRSISSPPSLLSSSILSSFFLFYFFLCSPQQAEWIKLFFPFHPIIQNSMQSCWVSPRDWTWTDWEDANANTIYELNSTWLIECKATKPDLVRNNYSNTIKQNYHPPRRTGTTASRQLRPRRIFWHWMFWTFEILVLFRGKGDWTFWMFLLFRNKIRIRIPVGSGI
jgi:hypothetical protein